MAVRFQDGRKVFEGCVLSLREMNGYDDSDFYALVWDAEKGEAREIEYATTRGYTYDAYAGIDATDEVLAAYAAWKLDRVIADLRAAEHARLATVERDKMVALRRTVRSRKGGSFAKGEVGRVFWLGADRYTRGTRVGVEFTDGRKHFFNMADVEVLVADEDLASDADIREHAEYLVNRQVESIRDMAARKVGA